MRSGLMNECRKRVREVKSEANIDFYLQPLGRDHLLPRIVVKHDARYITMPWGLIKLKIIVIQIAVTLNLFRRTPVPV
jgi:hypothetical protein